MEVKETQIKPPMKTWTVWFEQVNATMFTGIRARTAEEAEEKAARRWKREDGEHPTGGYVEEET